MREHEVNKLDNFMIGWYMDDTTICDTIINAHNESPEKRKGIVNLNEVNENIKDSTDVFFQSSNKQLCDEYINTCLNPVTKEYIKKYSWCNSYAPWRIIDNINIQHYKPNGGFYSWHTERASANEKMIATRHLVFMTYLNDVTDAGETEFFYQKLKIKPEKGLTLIWPADWTFTHKGVPSPSQDKYIVTGWFNFV